MSTTTTPVAEADVTDGLKPARKTRTRKPAAKAAPKAKSTPKAKASPKAPKSAAKYPAEISEAVKLAKVARGTTHGAPGAKQHVAVRDAISAEIDGDVTKASLLRWLGITQKDLIAAASGGMATSDLRKVDTFKKVQALAPLQDPKIRPWVGGRNGASILIAWVEQLNRA